MLQSYLLTAIRNILRNVAFSAINILGLAIGITASLVIFMIVYHEFNYDKFQPEKERIFRVVLDASFNGVQGHSSGVMAPLASAVQNELTGLESVVPVMHFQGDSKTTVEIPRDDNKKNLIEKQDGVVFTNGAYFSLLKYRWLTNAVPSLSEPFQAVLTESRARLYFPEKSMHDVVGSTLTYKDGLNVTVTGVVADLEENTVFTAKEFVSYSTIQKTALKQNFMMDIWDDWMAYSQLYVKLADKTAPISVEKQLQGLVSKYNNTHNQNPSNALVLKLQPLADIHFNNKYQSVSYRHGHKPTLYGLLAIGAFLLLLGCINFINLTTAQSVKRAKEIGIRKTLGSLRRQVVLQFLTETFVLTVIAGCVSVMMIPLLLKMFSDFIPPGIDATSLTNTSALFFFALLIVTVSILSGIYPAFILSGFKPVKVLKNQSVAANSTRSSLMRKTLTVTQFVIAQFFIIATLMVSKQIRYSLEADLGFDKQAVINFDTPHDTIEANDEKLFQEVKLLRGVEFVATGFFPPASQGAAYTVATAVVDGKEVTPNVNVQLRWGTPEYLDVYRIKLVAGRNVWPSDTLREYLVNESYAKAIGFVKPSDAVGHFIKQRERLVPIVGVIKDFHDQSMHGNISPLIFAGKKGNTFHIRLKNTSNNTANWKNTIIAAGHSFQSAFPGANFDFTFFDESLAQLYYRELNTTRLLAWAAGLAIIISCLGLAGLVIYTTHNRRKEIGIRKVMGASVTQITSTLSKDFLWLVILAFLITVPIAYWAVSVWLQEFVYRTNISWWLFVTGGIAMILIALITISLQTIRAARSNPVVSLRTE